MLETLTQTVKGEADAKAKSFAIRDDLLPAMDALRESCDKAETLVAKKDWPFPTYDDLLFW